MKDNNKDNNEDNNEENSYKINKIEGIDWDQIWQIPDGLNGPNSYIYPFNINSGNIQNYDQMENFINETFDTINNQSSLLEELFSAIEDAIDADFQNEYINSKIKDLYFKINPE
jgi:hypothetical protein